MLLEIGVEELPAWPLLKELKNIEPKWKKILEEYKFSSDFDFYYTPRRLVFIHKNIEDKSEDIEEELFGPPVMAAFKDGEPTKAALGFASKCGVDLDKLERQEKKGKEVLYFSKTIEGKLLKDVLGQMVEEFLKSLKFGKMMKWGSLDEQFIRPIRWIVAVKDGKALNFSCFGVQSGNKTFGHRQNSYEMVDVQTADYKNFLKEQGVLLDPEDRLNKVLEEIKTIEKESGVEVQLDEELLQEVVAITEHPTALLGEFDKEFLTLPPEVIITSMKEHQRYFAVNKDGKLTNNFVVAANSLTEDFSLIRSGNEKVLKPRLKDGMFFWENDLRNGLKNDGLESLVFAEGLGSVADKVKREMEIGKVLLETLKSDDKDLLRAIEISRADLMTEMVYEFTELQGVMGEYYAKAQNESDGVALAIKEQYMPAGEDDDVPSSQTGTLISIVTKFDSIMALFSVGKIPTGSKDPLALRRAANGIVKIIIEKKIDLNIQSFVDKISHLYKDFDKSKVVEFINERLFNIYSVNPSIVTAVLNANEKDLLKVAENIEAVAEVSNSEGFKEKFSTFKRVANIIKDLDTSVVPRVDTLLFKEISEKKLWETYSKIESTQKKVLLAELFNLKESLDNFFDSVMVNDKDEAIKRNRQNLIATIYNRFLDIADIKEISV
ncbi:MAG: glycine--tRNA ligase subunit beta [Campylobacterales bacterium]|nr:glycine--tRNA ligase subunit beta [Campylobacterales bacterium]